uniref:CDGSH iron sulfur domain 1 n=1 Tax=Oryctolagus cuniculus TaxID=9986 RepID=A0A5F9D877_RABIT
MLHECQTQPSNVWQPQRHEKIAKPSIQYTRFEWIAAVTFAAGTAALGYLAYKRFYVKDHRSKAMVNLHIQKDNPKVVHAFDMEDLGDKAVYCRCWRSKKVRKASPSYKCHFIVTFSFNYKACHQILLK